MNVLLAVDPGIRGCGCAIFVGGRLEHAIYIKSPAEKGNRAAEAEAMAHAVDRGLPDYLPTELALEWPQIYASRIREGSSKEDPNDLLALCGVQAAIVARFNAPATTSYLPREWKGSLKKEASHTRIKGRLTPDELGVMVDATKEAKSLAHNVLDAIGIGLHHLGRFERRRVIPT